MPAYDGFRFDNDQGRTPTRPQPRQPDPEAAIDPIEHQAPGLLSSLEHVQLMAQCDDLGLHSSMAMQPS